MPTFRHRIITLLSEHEGLTTRVEQPKKEPSGPLLAGALPALLVVCEDAPAPKKGPTMLVYAWMLSLQSRLKEDRGATAVEYGLLVGLIAVAIVAVLLLLGPKLSDLFQNVTDELPAS